MKRQWLLDKALWEVEMNGAIFKKTVQGERKVLSQCIKVEKIKDCAQ